MDQKPSSTDDDAKAKMQKMANRQISISGGAVVFGLLIGLSLSEVMPEHQAWLRILAVAGDDRELADRADDGDPLPGLVLLLVGVQELLVEQVREDAGERQGGSETSSGEQGLITQKIPVRANLRNFTSPGEHAMSTENGTRPCCRPHRWPCAMSVWVILALALVLSQSGMIRAQERRDPPPRDRGGPGPAGAPMRQPTGGPYTHRICSASSKDGLTWTRDAGVRLEHASVPCALAHDGKVWLYYVDADRGPGKPESVGCAIATDGLNFKKQPLVIEGMPTLKALDPSVIIDPDGKFRLYYFGSNAGGGPLRQTDEHDIHLAVSDDGIRFREAGVVFRHRLLVDPDVFIYKGKWFMYVFGRGNTVIATSADGKEFKYEQELGLRGYGTVAPIQLADGRLRLYAFEQFKTPGRGNAVCSFVSADAINWTKEDGVRLQAAANEEITDPYVIRWQDGYKMYFKVQRPPVPQRRGEFPPGQPPAGAGRPRGPQGARGPGQDRDGP